MYIFINKKLQKVQKKFGKFRSKPRRNNNSRIEIVIKSKGL